MDDELAVERSGSRVGRSLAPLALAALLAWAASPLALAQPNADQDGDGIAGNADRCPKDPEDRDGFQDADGCPDPDNDGDGIADVSDLCLSDAEDRDGWEDTDGCPDPDNDHDGIADVADACPNDPETPNGRADADGCPD